MKKIFYFVAAIVAMSCCSNVKSKEVIPSNDFHCTCLLCKTSDSLDYWASKDSANGYIHGSEFDFWYDSLTSILVEMIDEWPDDSIQYYAIAMADDLNECPSFMTVIEAGFDGLCDFYAYPKRFGDDAVKVLDIDTDHPHYLVNETYKKEWNIYQNKVDSFFKYFYE